MSHDRVPPAHKEQQGHEQIRRLAGGGGNGRMRPPEARLMWGKFKDTHFHSSGESYSGETTCTYFRSMQPSRCVHEHSLLISGLFIANVNRFLCK